MYREIDFIGNIKSFAIVDEILYLSDSKIVSQYSYDGNRVVLISEKELQNLKTTNNCVFVNTINGVGFFINHFESICLNYPAQHIYYPYFLSYKRIDERKYSIIRNIEDIGYEKIIEISSTVFNIFNENYFRWNPQNRHIEKYSFPFGHPLWQFDLTILGEYTVLFSTEMKRFEVSKFLGTWQNELIVACEGGLVLSLDIETGKPIRHWDKLPDSADNDIKDVFRGNLHQSGHVYQLNLAANKVVAIYYRHIVEIDLFSGEIITKNLSESLSKHFISEFQLKSGYAEDETHYYTTVHFDKTLLKINYLPTAVCAINKETLKIDWYHRFDEDGKGDFVSIQVPQISNGKLYQLTANKVLHIFEKENE